MPQNKRRKELSRLMLEKVNGLELIMQRYQEVTSAFPPPELSPRQIIDAIVEREFQAQSREDTHGGQRFSNS